MFIHALFGSVPSVVRAPLSIQTILIRVSQSERPDGLSKRTEARAATSHADGVDGDLTQSLTAPGRWRRYEMTMRSTVTGNEPTSIFGTVIIGCLRGPSGGRV